MKQRIITILTDFGLHDPYVASMKGVILSINHDVQLIDISHEIGKFNIQEAAFKLAASVPYFKPSTIHLVVVDPGVGSDRKPLIVLTRRYFFIGPDNGVLSLAAEQDGIKRIIEIQNKNFIRKPVSNTFHGRDVFAPVAAYVAKRVALKKFGSNIRKMVKLKIPQTVISHNEIKGEILYIDGFGNIVTNINEDSLKKLNISHKTVMQLKIGSNIKDIPLCYSYSEVYKDEILAIMGSSGFLEISANQANAANLLNTKINDKISIKNI